MPISYSVDARLRLAHLTVTGSVTGPELAAAYRAYLTHPDWEPTFRVLWDVRHVEHMDIDFSAVQQLCRITEEVGARLGPGRTALLAHRQVDFDIANLYPKAVGLLGRRDPGREIQVYASFVAAAQWLGLCPEAVKHAAGTLTSAA